MQIKRKNSIFGLGAVLSMIILFNVGAATAFAVQKHEIAPEIMLELTNGSRTEEGISVLRLNVRLASAAEAKANDMFEQQYFNHESPSGKTPWEFIRSAGYEYSFAGENLAMDFVSAEGVQKAFMESASHRENILNAKYSEVGIAVKKGMFEDRETIIVVEEFGSPLYNAEISEFRRTQAQINKVNEPIYLEIEKDQAQTTAQDVPKKEDVMINGPEDDNSCNAADVESLKENGPEISEDVPILTSDAQYIFFKDFYICSAYIDNEQENTPNGYVAGIFGERGGDMTAAGPLKYLAIIDSFEKEIMLILLSFAVSMNLYYVSNEEISGMDG